MLDAPRRDPPGAFAASATNQATATTPTRALRGHAVAVLRGPRRGNDSDVDDISWWKWRDAFSTCGVSANERGGRLP